jgi:hypothetical protein
MQIFMIIKSVQPKEKMQLVYNRFIKILSWCLCTDSKDSDMNNSSEGMQMCLQKEMMCHPLSLPVNDLLVDGDG